MNNYKDQDHQDSKDEVEVSKVGHLLREELW